MPNDPPLDAVHVVPTAEEHVEGFNRALEVVARERRYIGLVEGLPLAVSRAFVHAVHGDGGVHLVAVDDAHGVVGWCDVTRPTFEGFRHVGRLGMGLLPGWRGRGLGRRLAEAALAAAHAGGIERVELEVFASNAAAIALYERLGFVREGVRRRARLLDGAYDDVVLMALLVEPSAGEPSTGEPST
jgi:RimJ/RimL family protein N-acetyltransferase